MNKLIKNISINFCSLNIFQKTILIIISSIFLFFFMQNFIFSSSFDILILRDVNNFSFQRVLRDYHENIMQLRLGKMFELYGYGYGWLFWMIHVVITFPFYLISLLGSDFLLIITARNISLLFMIGSCFFLFKSIRKYTNDKYIPYFAVLLFVSYPFFAFSAMSFKTTAQCTFFCTLTFYLMVRNSILSKKDLKYIAIGFAACIGTKLSTAIFSFLIALFLMDRFGFRLSKENFKNALYFLKYFIPSGLFFVNPSLFIAPFKWSLFTKYQATMAHFIQNAHANYGFVGDFLTKFEKTFSSYFLYKYILVLLVLMFVIKFIYDVRRKERNKFDFLYILIFLALSSCYLTYSIKIWTEETPVFEYIANYFSNFSFLLLLPLVMLDKVKKYTKNVILVLLVMLNTTLNFDTIKHHYLYYYTRYHSKKIQFYFEAQKEIQKLVGSSDQKLNFLLDYKVFEIYSSLKKNIYTNFFFDTISVVEKRSKPEFDYILLLNEGDKMLLNEKDFQEKFSDADIALKNTWIESRKTFKTLIDTGLFRNSKYQMIYNKNKLICFKRVLK